MATKSNSKSPKVIFNHNLPTLHVDGAMVSVRKDEVCFINLITETPEGAFEQGRFMINESDLKIVIDSLCASIEYYPKLPKKNKTSKPKNKQ